MHGLRFFPEVAQDALAAYEWYEAKAMGLGDEFLRVLYASLPEISRSPMLFASIYGDVRRCLLRRFPYAIYFSIDEQSEEVVVCGVFHCARDPRRTARTIHRRGK